MVERIPLPKSTDVHIKVCRAAEQLRAQARAARRDEINRLSDSVRRLRHCRSCLSNAEAVIRFANEFLRDQWLETYCRKCPHNAPTGQSTGEEKS